MTGTDLRDRPTGFARCFLEVLVKASGNPALAVDPRAVAASREAGALVTGFSYRDRMSGLSHHDDQGSSDRPQDLDVQFDPARIGAALASLDETPWTGDRPPLGIAVALDPGTLRLSPDDRDDVLARTRAALSAAAVRYAVPLATPLAEAVRFEAAPGAGSSALRGAVTWDDARGGWDGAWAMAWEGREYRWAIHGASLDEAFRDAILGALAVATGHAGHLASAVDAARASGRVP